MMKIDSYFPSSTPSNDDDDTLQLPTEVLVEHVIPFLDRQSLSRFGRTNKEFNSATSNLVQNLPWPTKLISDQHLSTINCIALSPDNQMLVAGCSDGSITLWDVKTGQLPSLEGVHWPGQAVTSIVFSKDGKFMATASTDHTIVIWRCCCCSSSSRSGSCYKKNDSSFSTATTTRMATWKKIHSGHVTCLTFSLNGDFLVSGHAYQERIRVWNLTTGSCTAEFRDANNIDTQVLSVDVSSDNRDIRTTLSDGSIKIWNILRGTYDLWVGGHINAVGQLPSGGIVVASSLSSPTSTFSSIMQDNQQQQQQPQQNTCALTLWNRERQKIFELLLDDEHPSICCFSTDAAKLASLHHSHQNNNSIIIWNVATGQVETTITAKEGDDDDDDDDEPTRGTSFDLLTFSDDSKLLAAVSTRGNQIRLTRT